MAYQVEMHVRFVDLKKQYERLRHEIHPGIDNILMKTNFIHGEEVSIFEQNFARYVGVKHCVGVANGTDALEIAIRSLDLSQESEIIVQGNTYIATCLGVVANNHKLVVCDSNSSTHMIDYEDMLNKITDKTRVIVVVHLYGTISPDIEKIQSVCKDRGIILLEDCAQAHGAKWNGISAGSFGTLSCFSFYPTKNLGAYGDAGAICTNDDILQEKIRKLANLGCKIKYHHEVVGSNSRLDTIQAVILDCKLRHLDSENEKRRAHANQYMQRLGKIAEKCHLGLPVIDPLCTPVFHLFVIRSKQRDALKAFLQSKHVDTVIHYPISITEVEAFKHLGLEPAKQSIQASRDILSLPMYPDLTSDEINYVCNCIEEYYEQ